MYGIFTYIYQTYQPNVGRYTIHWYYMGHGKQITNLNVQPGRCIIYANHLLSQRQVKNRESISPGHIHYRIQPLGDVFICICGV